jgi:DNA primase
MNSPDTPLYTKGSVLFALDKARDSIRRDLKAFFVEGYFDAMGLHQAGVTHAVATCGTALTDAHLDLVAHAGAREVFFIFDGDSAGIRGSQRACELAVARGIAAYVFVPPDGQDPDEVVLKLARKGFSELVSVSQNAVDFLLSSALAKLGSSSSVEERVRLIDLAVPLLRAAPTPLARDVYTEEIAKRLGVPAELVRRALAGKQAPSRMHARQATKESQGDSDPVLAKAERQILGFMLQGAEFCSAVERSGALLRFSSLDRRQVAESLLAKGDADPDAAVAAVDSDKERALLLDEMKEIQRGGALLADLEKKLTHYCRIAEESAARRKVARALRV